MRSSDDVDRRDPAGSLTRPNASRPAPGGRPLTAQGQARVEAALIRHGLLLMQGQWEIPSLADLLEGAPITTRGFSWDYVTAWEYWDELAQRADLAEVKLFRGRSTLVARPLWPAVHALAGPARDAVRRGAVSELHERLLRLVEAEPGIAGDTIRTRLGGLDSRGFQRLKNDLAQWLCICGADRTDAAFHTHDQAWFPWSGSKIALATSSGEPPSPEEALAWLVQAVFAGARPARPPRAATLFPVARWAGPAPFRHAR